MKWKKRYISYRRPERDTFLRYAENNRSYDERAREQCGVARQLYGLYLTLSHLNEGDIQLTKKGLELGNNSEKQRTQSSVVESLVEEFDKVRLNLDPYNWEIILNREKKLDRYTQEAYRYTVRDKEIEISTQTQSLSGSAIPKVVLPRFEAWDAWLNWALQENVPGEFPYTAGLYPFKRTGEDPTRMFAGEGGPERTNRRFHYVSLDMPAKRLSTAFDSVTLYGSDPDRRPEYLWKNWQCRRIHLLLGRCKKALFRL